jgi:hypothetical protein
MAHREGRTECMVEIGTEDTIIDQYKSPHALYQSADCSTEIPQATRNELQ